MQGRQRQGDADRTAQGEPTCIVHEILLCRSDTYRVAIKSARIGALNDLAEQYKAALCNCIGIAEARIFAAEMRVERRRAWATRISVDRQRSGIDRSTPASHL